MKISPRQKRIMRHQRVRSTVSGTAERPRLAVFRSNIDFMAQVIDDTTGKTLLSFNAKRVKDATGTKTEIAAKLGEQAAKEIAKAGIKHISFDRGGFAYHGRVKAFAEAARNAGLTF